MAGDVRVATRPRNPGTEPIHQAGIVRCVYQPREREGLARVRTYGLAVGGGPGEGGKRKRVARPIKLTFPAPFALV